MRYLSLFSGIGGFELGIKQAYEQKNKRMVNQGGQMDTVSRGQEKEHGAGMGDTHAEQSGNEPDESIPICVGFSEIDRYATQIYQSHFPDHKNWGDITKIKEDELPDFDLLVGGFPCPSFSIAGKRKGLEDLRGQLIFDVIRILRAKRPKNFLLENVKGLLSHDRGNTMEVICESLCDAGYAIDFEVLNSKNFGVPQNRERVLIVGKRIDSLPDEAIY